MTMHRSVASWFNLYPPHDSAQIRFGRRGARRFGGARGPAPPPQLARRGKLHVTQSSGDGRGGPAAVVRKAIRNCSSSFGTVTTLKVAWVFKAHPFTCRAASCGVASLLAGMCCVCCCLWSCSQAGS